MKKNNKINVGIVTTWFERGAAYVSRAYEDILSKDFDVYIYARGGEDYAIDDPNWDKNNVTWSPRLSGLFFYGNESVSRLHFYKWLKNKKIDIIFFNEQQEIDIVKEFSDLGFICGAYIDYYKKETVAHFDTYDFLVCNTKRHYSVFKNHKNCYFIQWGVDINLYKPVNRMKRENNNVTFFHSAGYANVSNFRKGTDLLLYAFQKVRGNANLIIHSQVPLIKFPENLKKLIIADKRIEFIEKTVPAPGLYYLGDVYVYPSKLEGIGLTVPEALSSGLPVITTKEQPMSEFVIDSYNGFLIDVELYMMRDDNYYWPLSIASVDDLTKKMQKYVDNVKTIEEHAKNARNSAVMYFDWNKNSKKLNDYFKLFSKDFKIRLPGVKLYLKWIMIDFLIFSQRYMYIILKKTINQRLLDRYKIYLKYIRKILK